MSFDKLLNSFCTIQALSTTVNAIGEVVRSFSSGTQVSCRINPIRGGESIDSNRSVVFSRYRVFIPPGAIINGSSRLQQSGNNYNVLQVNDLGSHHLEIEIERFD